MNWDQPVTVNSNKNQAHRIIGNCRFRYASTYQNNDIAFRCAESKQCAARIRFDSNGQLLSNVDEIRHSNHVAPHPGSLLAKVRKNELKVKLVK